MTTRQKTLLQISSVVGYGSTGKIAEQIGQVALANGWRSVIAFGRTMGRKNITSQSELWRIGWAWSPYLHWALNKIFDLEGFASWLETRRLIKRIERLKPDVIQLHNLHDHYLNMPLLFDYLRRAGTPVFYTLHDCWSFTGGCSYFTMNKCEKWRDGNACADCQFRHSWLDLRRRHLLWRERAAAGTPNIAIVPVSDWLADLARHSLWRNHKIVRIHNGVDLEVFKNCHTDLLESNDSRGEKKSVPAKKFTILGCASIWNERKGLRDFVALRERFSEDELRIVIVGKIDEKLAGTLPRGIEQIRRTNNQQELAALYREADLLVNPTYEDNFPTVNLEALACGTPVVTYAGTGGSAEALTPETGIVVPAGDIDGICSAISTVRSRGKSAYSSACRSRAEQFFDMHDRFRDYLKLYESALAGT